MGDVLSVYHERVDEVPLLIGVMQRLGLPELADRHLGRHGHHQGLSPGTLLMVWLAYLLAYADHRKAAVAEWASRYPVLLEKLLGVELRPTEFTDDRLALLLGRLSEPTRWHALEADLWQHTLAVYALPATPSAVRLDATSTYGYHASLPGGLLQLGRSKDHRPDLPQLVVMAAALEPAGHLVGVDVHPGNRADDPCYLPLLRRVSATLGQAGLLYVGDCKMAALGTRAAVVAQGDYYLMPLPRSGEAGVAIAAWVERLLTEAEPWNLVGMGNETCGGGREFVRTLTAPVPAREAATSGERGEPVTWEERVQVFRSLGLWQQQRDHLDGQLARATAALWALTPALGQRRSGKRRFPDEAALAEAVRKVAAHYRVEGLLQVGWQAETLVTTAGSRTRWVITAVEIDAVALAARRERLGFRVQVTNAPAAQLSFSGAVVQYRGGWCLERVFHLVKDTPLGIQPLYVRRDDQVRGLTHLLTLAARLLTLLEIQLRHSVAQTGELFCGLYVGQEARATARPTATQVLGSIARAQITLTRVELGGQAHWHLTPLPPLLERTLTCLQLSPSLYQRLIENST